LIVMFGCVDKLRTWMSFPLWKCSCSNRSRNLNSVLAKITRRSRNKSRGRRRRSRL